MLQRVPPDIRIFTPSFRFFSSNSVFRPRSPALAAAMSPAAPAPITMTSQVVTRCLLLGLSKVEGRGAISGAQGLPVDGKSRNFLIALPADVWFRLGSGVLVGPSIQSAVSGGSCSWQLMFLAAHPTSPGCSGSPKRPWQSRHGMGLCPARHNSGFKWIFGTTFA